jgi:hypothetical protein
LRIPRRRDFIALLGGVFSWPFFAHAQQKAIPVVGFLRAAPPAAGYEEPVKAGFLDGLAEGGYVEGKNVSIEYRSAEGHYDRLPALAADLVRQQVAVIVGSTLRPHWRRKKRQRPSRLSSSSAMIRSSVGLPQTSIIPAGTSRA